MVVKTAIYVSFKGFKGKHLFLKIEHGFNLLRTLRWKKWVFQSKIFFQGSTNKNSRFRRNISMKKDLSFEKVFFFCCHVWSLSDSFVLLQNCLVRCAKPPIIVQRAIIGKINLENLFFYSIFGLWAEKTWTFNKTVRHDSQKRSLSVQMNFYRKFSGRKTFCMKVFGQWTEISDFRRKWFLRVFKGAVHVSSATLWGKDDKSKLYILWLVWDFVGFLLLWGQKASQGCQNDKLSVQSKT